MKFFLFLFIILTVGQLQAKNYFIECRDSKHLHRSTVTVDSDVCDSFNSRYSFSNTKDYLEMISRKYTQNPNLKLKPLAEENIREAVRLQCDTIKEFL